MKKLITAGIVSLVVLATAYAIVAPHQNFAGTWALDKSKSEGLGRNMENAEVTMVVTQDDRQLTVETQAGGPGEKFAYNLDGSKTTADVGGRMPGKASLAAAWEDGGRALSLNQERTMNFNGNDVTITIKEHWSLDGSGNVLTIKRTSESPRGTRESTLTFNRK
jgi:hypothetical protein